jgi:hypothetical protein
MGYRSTAQPFLALKTSPFRIFSPWPQLPLAEIKIFAGL